MRSASSFTRVIKAIVACIAAAWLSGATPAEACTCVGRIPACQGVWMSDAVFVGRVLDITNVEEQKEPRRAFLESRRVTFEVLEQFRGDSLLVPRDGASGVEVFTSQGTCGIDFKKGESYLVFATTSKGSPSLLQTGLCNRTRELSRALEEMPYLRALATSSPRGGRVYGYIELSNPQMVRPPLSSARPERKRLADVRVTLTDASSAEAGSPDAGRPKAGRAGVTKTTSTNTLGYYEFTDLAPGKYRVEASLPDNVYVSGGNGGSPFAGELLDTRGCSEVNLYVSHDGRVSGRLLDARGAPVAGLTIALLGAYDVDSPYQGFSFIRTLTNRDGSYELTKVPPGRYVAAIHVERDMITRKLLQPRILHPGVERSGDATTFDVGPGERVKLSDWTMPPSHALVILRGTVTAPDGQPAAGVKVSLSIGEGRDLRLVGENTITDAKGQFGLSALEGQRYRLQAYRYTTTPKDGAGSAGDVEKQTLYEYVRSEAFIAAADAPWFTLRLEMTPMGVR